MPRPSAPSARPCSPACAGGCRRPSSSPSGQAASPASLLGRDGALAGQIGPLIADDDAVACALFARALDGVEGPLFVDLADGKTGLRGFLDARGFAALRPFTRMRHGSSARFDDAARTFAVVGPEFG